MAKLALGAGLEGMLSRYRKRRLLIRRWAAEQAGLGQP